MKILIIILVLLIHIVCSYIHYFKCYGYQNKTNWCYSGVVEVPNAQLEFVVDPTSLNLTSYISNNCFLRCCDEIIPFIYNVYCNWTCYGEPSLSCNVTPSGSFLNCFQIKHE